mmetsp:Transcript_4600/g.9984  ORF Transcript_4600/g.9984 Transcript_4600/m.9984 type:complete len:191 (-) Transcript_4600:903-1475(-)
MLARRVLQKATGALLAGSAISMCHTAPAPRGVGLVPLTGATLMVFGGSSGIGKAVAVAAAKQGATAVHIIGRDAAKLAAAKLEIEAAASPAGGCTVCSKSLDATDEPAVRAYLNTFADESIDHLVTTPGGSARLGNLIENKRSCDDVRKQLDLKFFAQLAPVLAVGNKIRGGGLHHHDDRGACPAPRPRQ